MDLTHILVFSIYFLFCVLTGFIAAGKGLNSDRATAVLGGATLMGGVAGIIFACINQHWTYIAIIVVLYLEFTPQHQKHNKTNA